MRSFILICIFIISTLNATTLLTYNVYERSDRIDLMLSFDSPYDGSITKKMGKNVIILTLSDLTYDQLIEKSIDSAIVQEITIEPNNDKTNIILKSDHKISVIASKTVDGFGLRIRSKQIKTNANLPTIKSTNTANESSNQTFLQTKANEDLIDSRYISVIVVLLILLGFMFWLKNKVTNTKLSVKEKNSWLFQGNKNNSEKIEVNVLHKKQVDKNNSVVLLEFEGQKYLVMTGNSNLLLDKFNGNEINDNLEFEKAFEQNRQKLDEYLRLQNEEQKEDYRSKLERY
ncbi:hypothetical protein ACKGJI_03015 [Sulfurospirillum sp. 1307]